MTLAQQATSALKRAKYCKLRKKATEPHYHEAILARACEMVRENQAKGCHYTLETLRAIRRAKPKLRKRKGSH